MVEVGSGLPLPATQSTSAGSITTASSTIASLVPEQGAQVAGILRALYSRVPNLSNPFAGLTPSTLVGQVKLEVVKLVDVKAYHRPASAQDALARFRANVRFFRLTYSFVLSLVVLIYVISNASLFIAVGALVAMWSWFLAQPTDSVLKIGSFELKRGEKLVGLIAMTTLLVVFGGLISAIFWISFQGLLIIGMHGAMREPVVLDALEELELENEKLVAPVDQSNLV